MTPWTNLTKREEVAFSPAGKDRLPERRPLLPFLLFMFWGLPPEFEFLFGLSDLCAYRHVLLFGLAALRQLGYT